MTPSHAYDVETFVLADWGSDEPQGRFVIRTTRKGEFFFEFEDHGDLIASSPDFDTKERCIKAADAMKTMILVTASPESDDG